MASENTQTLFFEKFNLCIYQGGNDDVNSHSINLFCYIRRTLPFWGHLWGAGWPSG